MIGLFISVLFRDHFLDLAAALLGIIMVISYLTLLVMPHEVEIKVNGDLPDDPMEAIDKIYDGRVG